MITPAQRKPVIDIDEYLRQLVHESGILPIYRSNDSTITLAKLKAFAGGAGTLSVVDAENIYHLITGNLFTPEEPRLIHITKEQWREQLEDPVRRDEILLRRRRKVTKLWGIDLGIKTSVDEGDDQ